jgi:hypothetical protein
MKIIFHLIKSESQWSLGQQNFSKAVKKHAGKATPFF